MTKIDQLKILNNKIRANKAQYELDKKLLKYLHYQSVN